MSETSHDDDLMARLERISARIARLPCPEPEPPSPELELIRRLLEVPEEPEPHWGPPLSDAELAECEQCLGVSLPEDYRAFLTRVTRGGDWPFCLVWEPGEGSSEFGDGLRPDLPFPYTDSDPLVIAESNRQEYEEQLSSGAVNHGFVPPVDRRLRHELHPGGHRRRPVRDRDCVGPRPARRPRDPTPARPRHRQAHALPGLDGAIHGPLLRTARGWGGALLPPRVRSASHVRSRVPITLGALRPHSGRCGCSKPRDMALKRVQPWTGPGELADTVLGEQLPRARRGHHQTALPRAAPRQHRPPDGKAH